MLARIVYVFLILQIVSSQKPSPCPNILIYEPRSTELDRWNAVINLISTHGLKGIWLKITLDRPAELLGNVFGEATTPDNMEFLIKSQNFILEPGIPAPIRFFVKYNAASVVPSVSEINLNGRPLCSSTNPVAENVQSKPTTDSIGLINKPRLTPRPPIANSNRTRPTNTQRPTGSFNNNNDNISFQTDSNRPSTFSNGGRPANNNPNIDDYDTGSDSFGNNRDPDSQNPGGNDDFFAGDFSAVVNRPASNPSVIRPTVQRENQCGSVASQPRPLISYGQNTTPGQWPWHAALYHSKGIQLMYTCGGTLISREHIVTAAHCVTKPHTNRAINPQNILVYLGKYNLKKFGSEIQDKEVSDIYVHPEYNSTVFYNDIAILKLSDPAEFTNYVRPICLWEESTDLNEIEGKQGTVVGWGFDHNRELSTTLMQAQMPIVSTTTCIFSNRDFFSQFTSEKSFCAGFRNGTSVCNGDSGGGMVFPRRGTSGAGTIWQIRGLVSVGVALQGQGVCDPSQYIVFTDVAKHTQWIQSILSRNP